MNEPWNTEQDRLLLHLKAEHATATNRELAQMLVSKGVLTTSDAVQKRLRRLDEQAAAEENSVTDLLDAGLAIPSNPTDTFVGFDIGYWDLETTALVGWKGRLLSAAFADAWGRVESRVFTDFDLATPFDDLPLALWTRDKIESFDILAGWNDKGFDASFLRARLMEKGERVPRFPMRVDLMWRYGQFSVRIGSKKLANVSKFLKVANEKTEIDWPTWEAAAFGDADALAYVREHNEADVLVTRDVFAHTKQLITSLTH